MLLDLHRALLQRLMAAGALSDKAMLALLRELVDFYQPELAKSSRHRGYMRATVNAATVDECVAAINKELEFFAMKIAKAHYAAEGCFHYALVNLQKDDLAQKAHSFTPAQLALFTKIRAEIEEDDGDEAGTGAIQAIVADNLRQKLGSGLPAMDMAVCTATIEKLVADKWLKEANDGDDVLLMGPRSVIQAQY